MDGTDKTDTTGTKSGKSGLTLGEIDARLASIDEEMAGTMLLRDRLVSRFVGNTKVIGKRLDALATMHCNLAVAFVIAGLIANYTVGGPGSAGLLIVSLFNAVAHILSAMVWLGIMEDR